MKRCHSVKFNRILLRRRITFALGRHYVHERRAFDLSDVFESGDHLADVVTVNRADVLEPQTLEQKSWRHQSQEAITNLARYVFEILSARQAAQQVRQILLQSHAEIGGELLAEKGRHRPNPWVDKMLVIV